MSNQLSNEQMVKFNEISDEYKRVIALCNEILEYTSGSKQIIQEEVKNNLNLLGTMWEGESEVMYYNKQLEIVNALEDDATEIKNLITRISKEAETVFRRKMSEAGIKLEVH